MILKYEWLTLTGVNLMLAVDLQLAKRRRDLTTEMEPFMEWFNDCCYCLDAVDRIPSGSMVQFQTQDKQLSVMMSLRYRGE